MSSTRPATLFDLNLTITWRGTYAEFTDQLSLPAALLEPTALPIEVGTWCATAIAGEQLQTSINASACIPQYCNEFRVTLDHLNLSTLKHMKFPVAGRFSAVADLPEPCRISDDAAIFAKIVDYDHTQLTLDYNHPLADTDPTINFELTAVVPRPASSILPLDLALAIRAPGIGLQDSRIWPLPEAQRYSAMQQLDQRGDETFFAKPDLDPYWENDANAKAMDIYRKLIPDGARVLDLMAGVHSPLEGSGIVTQLMACAGLNATELAHNPLCTRRDVYNVNSRQSLPYAASSFDTVLIHGAIEYLVQPDYLFTEVARVLNPGGQIIITFSDRSIDARSIALWRDLHRLERSSLIISYLLTTGLFKRFQGFSSGIIDTSKLDRSGTDLENPVCAIRAERNSVHA